MTEGGVVASLRALIIPLLYASNCSEEDADLFRSELQQKLCRIHKRLNCDVKEVSAQLLLHSRDSSEATLPMRTCYCY